MKVLVTGGAGFIGSCLIKTWLRTDPKISIVNLDKLTYCGDLQRLETVEKDARYRFIQGDVCSEKDVEKALEGCEGVVHVAAETHVDRSLLDAKSFFDSNLYGTYVLLEMARRKGIKKFLYVSTDEVYGSIAKGSFKESDRAFPTNPYSISKTAGDFLALSYFHSYGLTVVVTRGSNTFGPYQYPEKVIPFFVSNALADRPLPLYGDGRQVRQWLYVEDHCRGILQAFKKGKGGEAYNISGTTHLQNIDLTRRILKILGKPESLIQFVKDRVGHDRRYAISAAKLKHLGWKETARFDKALEETVLWYRDHQVWWKSIKEKSEDFKKYYSKAYSTSR